MRQLAHLRSRPATPGWLGQATISNQRRNFTGVLATIGQSDFGSLKLSRKVTLESAASAEVSDHRLQDRHRIPLGAWTGLREDLSRTKFTWI